MKKLVLLTFLFILLSSLIVAAQDFTTIEACDADVKCPVDLETGEEPYCVYFFYGQGCSHCAQIEPLINELSLNSQYQNFSFKKLEIYYNETNKDLFDDFIFRYKISRAGVPAVFVGSDALIGVSQIQDNLEDRLFFYIENEPEYPLHYNRQETKTQHEISPASKIQLTLPAIVVAAAVDSINPCAFAVLAFLLIYLTSISANRRLLKIGFVYIAAVYITYFLAGLGLLVVAQSLNATRIIFNVAAVIAIAAGIINVKDYFWYGKGISLAIPKKLKPAIEKYVLIASVPAAVVLGFLVSMFELPCTGGIYLAILSLIAKNAYNLAVPYLLFYNFIFVLPLLVILLLFYFGLSSETFNLWLNKNKKLFRLFMGIIMLVIGIGMLTGVF